VRARRRHLQGALDVLLPLHVAKVDGIDRPGILLGRGFVRRDRGVAMQMAHQAGQAGNRDHLQALHQRRLGGVRFGHIEGRQPPFLGGDGHGQHAGHAAHPAIQGQLPDQAGARQVGPHLLGGQEDADGDGQIVGRALLAQVGRGQVDRQPGAGMDQSRIDEGSPDAL
jgi:hypothetical protein